MTPTSSMTSYALPYAVPAAPAATWAPTPAPVASDPTSLGYVAPTAAPVANATAGAAPAGGGAVTSYITSAVGKLSQQAEASRNALTAEIDSLSAQGRFDPAASQKYSIELDRISSLSSLAAKIQDAENQIIQRWLQ